MSRSVVRAMLALGGVLFLVLQLVRPELKNPPVTAEMQAPPEIRRILKSSCYNCHSNEIQVPWFDKVVPAYWLVTRDVNVARKRLNFSEIGTKRDLTKAILYESIREIQTGAMPPRSYRLMHPEATITPEQLKILRTYVTEQMAAAVKEHRRSHPGS
jgi:heme-binding protein